MKLVGNVENVPRVSQQVNTQTNKTTAATDLFYFKGFGRLAERTSDQNGIKRNLLFNYSK